ncbi:MAG: peroxidase family protein [Bdellovibrionia bacterium]
MTKLRVISLSLLVAFTALHLSADDYSPWGTWYRRGLLWMATFELGDIQKRLHKENLVDTYESFPTGGPECGAETRTARKADGTCNDLEKPLMGSAQTLFGRNIELAKTVGEDEVQMLNPNPRLVSEKLLARREFQPAEGLNMLAAVWIQFMTHDWFNHVENTYDRPYEIPNPLETSGLPVMFALRSKPHTLNRPGRPATYANENTHWWDGSQIYGSDEVTARSLRSGVDGKMRVTDKNRLSLDPKTGKELTGFSRNWWTGLSLLHHLFVLEHNKIADMLIKEKRNKPGGEIWTDDKIYDTARLINAASMAKIHTVEWTPAILANPVLGYGMRINWTGSVNPFRDNVNRLFNFSGLVGKKRELYGVPYSLTEEFVSVYRMHSLLPEFMSLRTQTGTATEIVELANARDDNSHLYTDKYSLGDLMFSFGKMHPGALRIRNFPKFLRNLKVPIMGEIDMGAMDVLRDRERGVPRYNKFREAIGLKRVRTFEELTTEPETLRDLKAVYANVEEIDLLVGCLIEPLPRGFGFGETAFQIFLLMASRRIEADRFFTTDYRAEIYTKEGLKWIDRASMKELLLRNMPDLKGALKNVTETFAPWK